MLQTLITFVFEAVSGCTAEVERELVSESIGLIR